MTDQESQEFKEKKAIHNMKMEELAYERETNKLFHDWALERERIKNGRVSEKNIELLYKLAKEEANIRRVPIATHSPKTLRGYRQAEHEIVKVIPEGWKAKTYFSGITESGNRIYSEGGTIKALKEIIKSTQE